MNSEDDWLEFLDTLSKRVSKKILAEGGFDEKLLGKKGAYQSS